MKPIEIHIEGYKIIIMEDKEPEPTKVKEEDVIKYVPFPIVPTSPTTGDWWQYPFATWTADDVLNGTSTTAYFHPVRDINVECTKCNVRTPKYDTEAEAIEVWNRAMSNRMELHTVKERTAKVEWYPHLTKLADGHCECGEDVRDDWKYCPICSARLEWK